RLSVSVPFCVPLLPEPASAMFSSPHYVLDVPLRREETPRRVRPREKPRAAPTGRPQRMGAPFASGVSYASHQACHAAPSRLIPSTILAGGDAEYFRRR